MEFSGTVLGAIKVDENLDLETLNIHTSTSLMSAPFRIDVAAASGATGFINLGDIVLQASKERAAAQAENPQIQDSIKVDENVEVEALITIQGEDPGTSRFQDEGAKQKLISCSHCLYKTKCYRSLMLHVPMHDNNRLVTCGVCNYRSVTSGPVKGHYHVKDWDLRNYICSFCDYRAESYNTLKKHTMARHTNLRPYRCHLCEYSTAWKMSLKNHITAKHTNYRPMKCPYCDYGSVQLSNLKRHILRKH